MTSTHIDHLPPTSEGFIGHSLSSHAHHSQKFWIHFQCSQSFGWATKKCRVVLIISYDCENVKGVLGFFFPFLNLSHHAYMYVSYLWYKLWYKSLFIWSTNSKAKTPIECNNLPACLLHKIVMAAYGSTY